MPLRDHFRPPLDNRRSWEGFHGQWPAMIVQALSRKLPRHYVAAPRIHFGSSVEFDVDPYEEHGSERTSGPTQSGNAERATTVVWVPDGPTLTISTNLPAPEEYEVRVYDSDRDRLVATVEIVSPGNKDRLEHHRAFVAKCAALLQQRVSVTIIDLVTTHPFNLYADLLELIGQSDPSLGTEPPPLYAVACRGTKKDDIWLLETWAHTLTLGQPLPTLPLWLADNLALPLELEATYEETCRVLRLP